MKKLFKYVYILLLFAYLLYAYKVLFYQSANDKLLFQFPVNKPLLFFKLLIIVIFSVFCLIGLKKFVLYLSAGVSIFTLMITCYLFQEDLLMLGIDVFIVFLGLCYRFSLRKVG